ncbi:MAG: AAA family ATPase [Solirubrobacterales bacterium]|nr:AAA family ATPase [Solirubrobacterales bacterium]
MLYGRELERFRIGELLEGARESRSGALVLLGEAGVGKSALLEDARDRASDMQVLVGRGIESEAQLPFAALHQILRPILGYLERLPDPQARALRGALGLETTVASDRFLIYLAALSLLAEAAEDHRVLCLVDDAHWLDEASADALVFVARRLEAEGIVMLLCARERDVRHFNASGLPELKLGPLPHDAAGALLDHQAGVALSPDARERLIAATGGNPLALVELPALLNEAQLSGLELLLDPLPVSARIERAFLARARELPDNSQILLLLCATDDTGDLGPVLAAAAQLGAGSEALDAVEQTGLVVVRGTRFEFRHPLVRSAVYQSAPLSRRRAAHRALAGALEAESQADRRAWHRAAASLEPDPSVVDDLERAAGRARERSGFGDASHAFERAAALTADAGERARRLTAAAESAYLAGRLERALLLLRRARPLATGPMQQADIDRYRGLTEMSHGIPADACQILLGAAKGVAAVDGERAMELLNFASVAAVYAGDAAAAVAIAALARGLTVPDSPQMRMLVELLSGLGSHFEGDFATAADRLGGALALEQQLEGGALADEPVSLMRAGRAAMFLGDDEFGLRIHRAAAARARSAGTLGLLTQILPRLGHAELSAGRWASAAANAEEGLALARESGQHDFVAYQLVLLALIAAHRGQEEACRSLAGQGLELASARRVTLVAEFARWALAVLELGLGHAAEAFGRAREISVTGAVFWAGLDRIEAAARAGETDAAREWLTSFEPWARNGRAVWARAVALHCRALLASEEEAEGLFKAALAAHGEAARPFERARTELAFGEFLRRGRRRVEAREHLRAALDGFEALGAMPWAERTRMELRASGQTARRRDPSTRDELTAQELQIASLVTQGLTNREVAAQLFLSPRTVDFHLRNVFRKLGVSSRTQLATLDLDTARAMGPPEQILAVSPVRSR